MRRSVAIFVAVLFLAGTLVSPCALAQGERRVVMILSGDFQPYRDAEAGFKDKLAAGHYPVTYSEFLMSRDAKENAELKEKITSSSPDLIFTVGTPASLFARENFRDIPVVFSMVLNPVENKVVSSMDRPDGNMYGVSLNIPIEEQLRALKRIKPDIKSIGMLYDVKRGPESIFPSQKAAEKISVKFIAEPVSAEKDISKGLDRVLNEADALWADADPLIYNSSTAQQIILATLKRRVPFMAFSRNFVKAGALAAMECDYYETGRQAGGIAARILAGKDIPAVKVEAPKVFTLSINKRTADMLGLRIDRGVLAGAEIMEQ